MTSRNLNLQDGLLDLHTDSGIHAVDLYRGQVYDLRIVLDEGVRDRIENGSDELIEVRTLRRELNALGESFWPRKGEDHHDTDGAFDDILAKALRLERDDLPPLREALGGRCGYDVPIDDIGLRGALG